MFAGSLLFALSQWCLLAVYARLGGRFELGRYAYALAVVSPIMIFAQLGLRQLLVTDIEERYTKHEYLTHRLLSLLAAYVAIIAAAIVVPNVAEEIWVVMSIALAKSIDNVGDIVYGFHQRKRDLSPVALSLATRGVFGAIAGAVCYAISNSLVLSVLATAAVWLVVLVVLDLRALFVNKHYQISDMRANPGSRLLGLTKHCLPIGLGAAVVTLNVNVPRYFIEHNWGKDTLGTFAALAHFISAGGIVISSLWKSASSLLATHYYSRRVHHYVNLLLKLVCTSISLGLIGYVLVLFVGDQVVVAIYGDQFDGLGNLFEITAFVALISFSSAILFSALTTVRRARYMPIISCSSLAVNVIVCFLLVPKFGAEGALYAWGASLLMSGALSALLVHIALGVKN